MQILLTLIFVGLAGLFVVSLSVARKRAARIANTAQELEKAITTLVGAVSETKERVAKQNPQKHSLSTETQNELHP